MRVVSSWMVFRDGAVLQLGVPVVDGRPRCDGCGEILMTKRLKRGHRRQRFCSLGCYGMTRRKSAAA